MDDHAVVLDRHACVFGLIALLVISSGSEVDVVRLPREWRKAHVDRRSRDRVDPSAFVVLAFQAKRIEYLAFVAALDVDAAVAAALAACGRHERRAELDVQQVVAKLSLR